MVQRFSKFQVNQIRFSVANLFLITAIIGLTAALLITSSKDGYEPSEYAKNFDRNWFCPFARTLDPDAILWHGAGSKFGTLAFMTTERISTPTMLLEAWQKAAKDELVAAGFLCEIFDIEVVSIGSHSVGRRIIYSSRDIYGTWDVVLLDSIDYKTNEKSKKIHTFYYSLSESSKAENLQTLLFWDYPPRKLFPE